MILDPTSGRYRKITPVVCERLNGFPDGWTDTGMTERQRYFTMGNALVVYLVNRMGETLIEIVALAPSNRCKTVENGCRL